MNWDLMNDLAGGGEGFLVGFALVLLVGWVLTRGRQ